MDIYTNEIKELLDEVNTDETENIEPGWCSSDQFHIGYISSGQFVYV